MTFTNGVYCWRCCPRPYAKVEECTCSCHHKPPSVKFFCAETKEHGARTFKTESGARRYLLRTIGEDVEWHRLDLLGGARWLAIGIDRKRPIRGWIDEGTR